jgi:opacity protein-like surface antigen
MISTCRIHRARNRVDSLPLALLFAVCLLTPVTGAMGQYAAGSTSEEAGVSWFPSVPLQITAGVDIGYDDHVIGSNATTSSSSPSSFFARENLVLSYNRPGERTQVKLLGVGRFAQFFDAGTDDKDGNVTFSLTHNFSTRLSFRADAYAAYQTEPDFGFNVGPENVRAPHFSTNDIFSVTYHWLPRFAMVTSYTFQRVKYAGSSQASQDRFQNTLGERLQFSLTRRTNLVGEYRFEIVDYDTAPRDSVTHFALAGIDHNLTEHLSVNVLGGESFRSFKDDGDTINPYVEGKLAYQSSNHSLSWTTSYRVEQPSAAAALTRTTLRTGLRLTYDLTSRISSTAAVYYHHDENEDLTSSGLSSGGTQDSFNLTLGLRYTINKHFAMHVNYEHSAVGSLGSTPGYSRNRYFGGLTYTY